MDSSKSAIQAWEYNPKNEDQMLPHKYEPNRPVPLSHVHDLGILTWKIDVSDWENDPQLKKITSERGYKYSEVITVSRDAMVDFDAKVKGFFREHMHSQEESRLILGGTGYWDIRDYDEKWIRFYVQEGDLVVLPPGMYHRFTLDSNEYIKALLLYTEIPARTQQKRSDDSVARKIYVEKYLSHLQQQVKAQ